jgi:cysteine desulfurase
MVKKSKKSKKKKVVKKKKEIVKRHIYLDNNSTTIICQGASAVYNKWLKCYNPSSTSNISQGSKQIMKRAKSFILSHCKVTDKDFTVVFTSGATESNCFILRSSAESYRRIRKIKPHIIISAIEHHSILECAKSIEEAGYAEISYAEANMYGCILPEEVEKHIKSNTCLISIMYANNETGAINNIPKIGELAHKHKIPLHSDSVQIFGKYPLNLKKSNVDAISVSFHKFYGPKGIGMLILRNDFITGYDLKGQICGSQQNGLRGGTENIPAIAAAAEAIKCNFKNRKVKNVRHLKMRNYIIEQIKTSKIVSLCNYSSYLGDHVLSEDSKENEIVILGPPANKPNYYLHNTLLLSIVKNTGKDFCNVNFKKDLDKMGLIVSIASACLTASDKASHVLTAIGAPDIIKRGTLRISIGDHNTMDEIKIFTSKFLKLLKIHLDK